MATSYVPIRPKLYHDDAGLLGGDEADVAKPKHGHAAEFVFGAVRVCSSTMYVVGSTIFMQIPGPELLYVGEWLFIIASGITTTQAFMSLREAWVSLAYCDLEDFPSEEKRYSKKKRLRAEVFENVFFVISSIIFFLGSSYFWPGRYGAGEGKYKGYLLGTWCYIIGSGGYVLSSYWNACGLAFNFERWLTRGTRQSKAARLSFIALGFNMFGSMFFACGSFLAQPGYSLKCNTDRGDDVSLLQLTMLFHHQTHRSSYKLLHAGRLAAGDPETNLEQLCLSTSRMYHWLFLFGSCCFLVNSCLGMAGIIILSAPDDEDKTPRHSPTNTGSPQNAAESGAS
mmetsp:Transcript_81258/g.204463  ORF Transcript_81258/g.204463 Transcript_81258/m.204463 type:complete len:340 (-) Transcript_81258:47-1066(-)